MFFNVLPGSGSAWIRIHFQNWILIRICLKSWIRILIRTPFKSWIRIRIKSMRILNTDTNHSKKHTLASTLILNTELRVGPRVRPVSRM
jgi:hypothetical protein